MTKSDKVLVILLRLIGAGSLFALVPVCMPFSWLITTHRWLGLGDMPTAPVVEYLARSVSAFYALFGALFLFVASDLGRYRSLAQFLGAAVVVFSVILLGVDMAAEMPWWWASAEGLGGIVVGALIFYLAQRGKIQASKQ
jgi:hypothetical protein